jgi:cytosine/uracil/thiamine/allantoin permease
MSLAAEPVFVISLDSWPVTVLRGFCILLCFVNLVLLVPVGLRQRRSIYRETLLFILFAGFTVVIFFTEIGRLGHIVTWRLPLSTLCEIGLTWWLIHYLRLPMSFVTRRRTEPDPKVKLRRDKGTPDGT